VAVYIVGTTSPETIESYAVTLFKNWRWPGAAKPGIGKEGKDNGVLLLVAIEDRKMRIEVGYGLEGTIPDAVAKRIVENLLLPRFREKKFDEGIAAATEALAALIAGESAGASAGLQPTPAAEEKPATAAGFIVPLAVFLGVIGFIVAIAILARKGGGSAGSGGHSGSSSGGWSSGGGSSGGSSGGGSSFGGSGGGRSGGGGASGSW
ncbi:MAG: TPM domain-containing protein, partial [Candidatus Aureabacteria bacterium]|nr:TPM domain-containing protein [Candidatus Auribacterota bacterium]